MSDAPGKEPAQRRAWRWSRIRRWLVRGLLVSGVSVLLVGGVLAAVIVRFGQRDRARPADVIIVLGGGTDGTTRRAEHAVALYHQGYAPYIVCSGGGGDNYPEAVRCLWVALSLNVPYEAVICEKASLSTEENAREVALIMAAYGWETAILVTDDYHLWRATWLFREKGLNVYPSPAQKTTGALSPWETAYSLFRELLATGWQVGKSVLGLPFTCTPLNVPRLWVGIVQR